MFVRGIFSGQTGRAKKHGNSAVQLIVIFFVLYHGIFRAVS